jgi:hypothetical protein
VVEQEKPKKSIASWIRLAASAAGGGMMIASLVTRSNSEVLAISGAVFCAAGWILAGILERAKS